MKIFSWNVFFHNPIIVKGLKYISTFDPDVICLQEFPDHKLPFLKEIFSNYYMAKNIDTTSRYFHRNSYNVLLSRDPIISINALKFGKSRTQNFITKYFYKLQDISETGEALVCRINHHGSFYKIANLRLSYPATSLERISQLNKVFKYFKNHKNTFLCGDFNLVDTKYFGLIQKFILGYFGNQLDYLHEKAEFSKLIRLHEYKNPLENQGTYLGILPSTQPDRILYQKTFQLIATNLHRYTYGSDHHIVSIELA